jgi:hypothetical protein
VGGDREPDERDEREYVWEFDTLLEGGVFGQRKKILRRYVEPFPTTKKTRVFSHLN